MSTTGMFLKTDRAVLPGMEVAVVLRTQLAGGERPIFLIGRVMRRQMKPVAGVGVRWERAATPDKPEVLAEFLRTTLHMEPWGILRRPLDEGGIVQSVFEFDIDGLAKKGAETAPEAGGESKGFAEDTDETLDDTVQDLEEAADKAEKTEADKPAGIGPLTREMKTLDAEAPSDLSVEVQVGGRWLSGRVTSLSSQHLFLARKLSDAKVGDKIVVKFKLPVKGGETEVTCRCEVLMFGTEFGTSKKGVILKLTKVEEGKQAGIFGRYVRWLHFNALRKG